MRWGGEPPFDYEQWHSWFAWHPVRCEGEGVWFEWIERMDQWTPIGHFWKYRFREPLAPAWIGLYE